MAENTAVLAAMAAQPRILPCGVFPSQNEAAGAFTAVRRGRTVCRLGDRPQESWLINALPPCELEPEPQLSALVMGTTGDSLFVYGPWQCRMHYVINTLLGSIRLLEWICLVWASTKMLVLQTGSAELMHVEGLGSHWRGAN